MPALPEENPALFAPEEDAEGRRGWLTIADLLSRAAQILGEGDGGWATTVARWLPRRYRRGSVMDCGGPPPLSSVDKGISPSKSSRFPTVCGKSHACRKHHGLTLPLIGWRRAARISSPAALTRKCITSAAASGSPCFIADCLPWLVISDGISKHGLFSRTITTSSVTLPPRRRASPACSVCCTRKPLD
ncbi:MAG: hypothetical protein RLZZ282_1269, partial [Verrucomicrobiota bacterium]